MNRFKPQPGTIGYLRRKKRWLCCILLMWAAVIAGIITVCYCVTGTKNNIGTVIGILLVLPAAKSAVAWLMLLPYRSEDAELVTEAKGLCASDDRILCDLVLTRYEGRIYLPLVLIRSGRLYAASPVQKMETALIRQTLSGCIPSKDAAGGGVRLFDSSRALTAWMEKTPGPGAGTDPEPILRALLSKCI